MYHKDTFDESVLYDFESIFVILDNKDGVIGHRMFPSIWSLFFMHKYKQNASIYRIGS